MGIIQNIKNKIDDKRMERFRRYLLMIQKQDFEYNPFKLGMPQKLIDTSIANLELVENLTWGSGDGAAIRQFYNKNIGQFVDSYDPRRRYFATTCPTKFRYIHSGLPNLISNAMSQIIFGNGYSIEGIVYNDDLEKDEEKSKKATDLINYLISKLHIDEKLTKSTMCESVGGDVAWKLSYDFELSPYPILEVEDRRYYTLNCERGIEKNFEFKTYIEKTYQNEKKQYIFVETYGTDDLGNFCLYNNLYQNRDGKLIPISLSYLDETKELEAVQTTNYVGKLAFHKKNQEYVGIISDYPYGASDYPSGKDCFDAADESISAIISEIRENKTIREWDETMLGVDSKTGNFKMINEYITNYVAKPRSNDQNQKGVAVTQFQDKTVQHIEKLNSAISLSCAACGISPISLGLKGDTAVDSDDATLKERTEITRQTAKKKKAAWKSYLESVIPEIVKFAKWLTMQTNYPFNAEATELKQFFQDIEIDKIHVDVQIADFDQKSIEDKLTTWAAAKGSGISSIENVIDQVYGTTWTSEEKQQEVNRIKVEQNITLDNPELLQFENEE